MYSLWEDNPALRLAVCCGGVVGMLGVYGFQQERVMAVPYGTEYFSYSIFLVLLNRVFAAGFAFAMVLAKGESVKSTPPLWKYALVSISNVAATTCQYEALKFVSFPVQMLGKSSKMVPVMGWGMAINGRSYGWKDWLIALAVTGGCTLFLVAGDIGSAKHRASGDSGGSFWMGYAMIGLLLMLGYLVCDGFTSTFQEKLFKEHHVTTYNQMLYVNLFSILVSCCALLSFGGFPESIAFAQRHPGFMMDITFLAMSATFGQVFIYSTIFWFGALVFAATMNARQLISILISIQYHSHPVTMLQWTGMALCFGGLFTKTYLGHLAYVEKEREEKAKSESAA
jgi:adenosine 3'-phospho 5'-phosphosulfate transporter B2